MMNTEISHTNKGFTLIEVLIALCIFSVAMLALAKMQVFSLRDNNGTAMRSLAIVQVNNMAERLRANPPNASLQNEIALWNKELGRLLPLGYGQVAKHGDVYTLTIVWEGPETKTNFSNCHGTFSKTTRCVSTEVTV